LSPSIPERATVRAKPGLRCAFVLCVAAFVAPTWAQATADPAAGRALFDDTPSASGLNNLTGSCVTCHGSVQNRRIKIGASAFADISVDTALARLAQAIGAQPDMRQFSALDDQQVRDLAAYLADTPETSAAQLDFTASAINAAIAAQFVDLRSAVATSETLHIDSVTITGNGASKFTRSSDTCDQATLQPGLSCRVTVTFKSPDLAGASVPLTLTMRQGASATPFTRTVLLVGSVTPPPSDGGGGAVGAPWLFGLALAAALLRRRPG